MQNTFNNTIIFSAERSDLTPGDNSWRSNELMDTLDDLGISFRTVRGVYKGTRELSVVIHISHYKQAMLLAKRYNQ
jgi:hypothetical protein